MDKLIKISFYLNCYESLTICVFFMDLEWKKKVLLPRGQLKKNFIFTKLTAIFRLFIDFKRNNSRNC